jgi:chorismate mutase
MGAGAQLLLLSTGRSLDDIRAELRRLEEPLVQALVERSHHRRNQGSPGPLASGAAPARLAACYRDEILPFLCAPGDDGKGEESAAADERLLALLAARVGLGKAVADAKALREPERFAEATRRGDRAALLAALTDPATECSVLARVRAASERLGSPPDPDAIAEIFARWVIPLTKEIEADRLLGLR